MIIRSSYFDIEKISGWFGPSLMAAFTASEIKSSAQENMVKSRLTPLDRDSSYRLQSPYAYQFDGGKHLPTKPVIGTHTASNF